MRENARETSLTKIFHYVAIVLFFILFLGGLYGTAKEQILVDYTEMVVWGRDNIFLNLLKFGGAVAVVCLLGQLYNKFCEKWNSNILLAIVCVAAGIFSIYWVSAASVCPVADQQTICEYAVAFNRGDYEDLQKLSYLSIYPQQLGLITLLRGFFALFGDMNYRAFQYFSALFIPLLILSGAMVLRHLTDRNRRAESFYLLFALVCMPMYLYVPFVYGELASTALGMMAFWILLSTFKKFHVAKVVGLALTVGVMVQFRKNTLILVVALCVVILLKLISKFTWQMLATGLGVIAGVLLLQGAINLTYADVRDESLDGLPAVPYLTMGLNDENGGAGWYTTYAYMAFVVDGEADAAKANKLAWEDYKERMGEMVKDPAYFLDFYSRKMNYQWNAPMYQSRAMTYHFDGELKPLAAAVYGGPKVDALLQGFMKIYQLLLYGSLFFYLLIDRKRKAGADKYILLIAVFGGFLFSMMWETKTRYVFPYLLMLLPMYGIAVDGMVAIFSRWFVSLKKKVKK